MRLTRKLKNGIDNWSRMMDAKFDLCSKGPGWRPMRNLGESRVINSAYKWVFLIPLAATALESVESPLNMVLFGAPFKLNLALPFSLKVLYLSAISAAFSKAAYAMGCPQFLRDFESYGQFMESGRANYSLVNEFGTIVLDAARTPVDLQAPRFVMLDLIDSMEDCIPYEESYLPGLESSISPSEYLTDLQSEAARRALNALDHYHQSQFRDVSLEIDNAMYVIGKHFFTFRKDPAYPGTAFDVVVNAHNKRNFTLRAIMATSLAVTGVCFAWMFIQQAISVFCS